MTFERIYSIRKNCYNLTSKSNNNNNDNIMSSGKSGKFSRAWRAIYTILSTELIHSSSPLKSHRSARSYGRIYHIKSHVCYVQGLPSLVFCLSVKILTCLMFVCQGSVLSSAYLSRKKHVTNPRH